LCWRRFTKDIIFWSADEAWIFAVVMAGLVPAIHAFCAT
jgi:hypothetical protein